MSQRKKSRNFTEKEKLRLIAIVDKYKHVVENKATDGTTIKAKLIAWQGITEEYNLNCESEFRASTQLKALYKNIKAKIRKDVAVEKYKVKCNDLLNIQKNIGVQVDFGSTDDVVFIKSPPSPDVALTTSGNVALTTSDDLALTISDPDLDLTSPTSSYVPNRRKRSQFYTENSIKKLYFEKKLQLINFQLKSAKMQHSIDMKIKHAQLKKLSLETDT